MTIERSALSYLFKIWTCLEYLLLIGYTAMYVLLLVLSVFGSIMIMTSRGTNHLPLVVDSLLPLLLFGVALFGIWLLWILGVGRVRDAQVLRWWVIGSILFMAAMAVFFWVSRAKFNYTVATAAVALVGILRLPRLIVFPSLKGARS